MDAGGAHLPDDRDRAGEFSFQGPLKVHLLCEIRHAELGLIEDLETDPTAADKAGAGNVEFQLVDVGFRACDQNGRPVDKEIPLFRSQFGGDRLRILRREVPVENFVLDAIHEVDEGS